MEEPEEIESILDEPVSPDDESISIPPETWHKIKVFILEYGLPIGFGLIGVALGGLLVRHQAVQIIDGLNASLMACLNSSGLLIR